MPAKEKLRLDKYLWCIRIFKSRTDASEACDNGKVKFMEQAAKASRPVHKDDEFEIKTSARKWKIKVTGLLYNRVQYAEAVKYYQDITPPEDLEITAFQATSFHTGKRLSKIGRPTKKQRRERDEFFEE